MLWTLLKRDIKCCTKPFLIIFAVICMYTTIIIYMYEPEFSEVLEQYQEMMPQLMSAVGMTGVANSLIEWIQIYLYGFIMTLFPLIFMIIMVQRLLTGYVDSGSVANLLSAPNSRGKIIMTQLLAAVLGVLLLMTAVTVVGVSVSELMFEGELDIKKYILLNVSTMLVWLVICGIAFLAACFCNESKYFYTFGAGVPLLFFLLQMISNMGEKLENLKYATIYTLLPAEKIISGEGGYAAEHISLICMAVVLFGIGVLHFKRKDFFC